MLPTIIQTIVAWATSFTGILTIMIIMITAIRLVLTNIREKHGKESNYYRNMKHISGITCLIIVINATNILIRSHISGLWGFLNQSLWYQCLTFAACYIAVSSIAMKYLSTPIAITINIALAFFGNYVDKTVEFAPVITIITVIVAFIVSLIMTDNISKARNATIENNNTETIMLEPTEATESTKSTEQTGPIPTNFFARHSFLAAMLWAGSLVVAYLAGEYSLVPKAVEYIQSQIKKYSATSKETATQGSNSDSVANLILPTSTD